ncbi:nitric oxide reductase activation protein NorD [Acidithiobacillus caldus]|uniref:nitric oxide reductase activation protein NorD n=1 Tax=Acidithiobacillus caldus TaxID=33059 RepID=UPI0007D9D88D|nr:VWA domain-containing protein [Acidithiobacillus caldus]AUW32917.1 VWA domain-containing protein [Acidithiobacillus caldus]MBU2761900.1 VWA domain-containing protein [Acidithiobacillus caldus]MBU2771146.1 VWA domain-containing protein [Acidithiobacillus caldus]MBU2802542.1 VWA domain-containing protein [Acidithiobacillus caldus]QER45749.1 rubisco activation protein cbbO [Acidithiobacillus caldus]
MNNGFSEAAQEVVRAQAWERLDTSFAEVRAVFDDLFNAALRILSPADIDAYIEAARQIAKLGRGSEPLLLFLEAWPELAGLLGGHALAPVLETIQRMQKSPNGRAIAPFLQSLIPVARRLEPTELVRDYLEVVLDLMVQTSGTIHGRQATIPSPVMAEFFVQAPLLLDQVSLTGLARWVDHGIRHYANNPDRQKDYFGLHSADSHAVLRRERHGTLLADVERQLGLYLLGLWEDVAPLVPYSSGFHQLRQPIPYYDSQGFHLPDAYDDARGVAAIDRYRLALAHMAGHRRWSQPSIADNWSPFQRLTVECFEDCRIDTLLLRRYPGLRPILLALHPQPDEDDCNDATTSCLRHRLVMLSRALLDPACSYRHPVIREFTVRFQALLRTGPSNSSEIAALALDFVTRTRLPSDQFARVHFADTIVDYRDDNRHFWRFIEPEGGETSTSDTFRPSSSPGEQRLPPRHYPEWDEHSRSYRPDWVSVYDYLHPTGDAALIDGLLQKHRVLSNRLRRLFDLLKPQERERIRRQEDGSELDLDMALRALIDYQMGMVPDPRISLSHHSNGRDLAVLLLLDLSQSLNETVAGTGQTVLQLSQEAVSMLAWAVDGLGDPFAIAGFHSNTRHDLRFLHIKGFSEAWDDTVKARLAGMQARWSTRMGAALRHATHFLEARKTSKKLLLILTDGMPSDVDVADPQHLIADARQAVRELEQEGIYPYCISLDPQADSYVAQIFGRRFSVVDRIEHLPEKLSEIFIGLTR